MLTGESLVDFLVQVLVLITGIALLIVGTTNREGQAETQMMDILRRGDPAEMDDVYPVLLWRARRIRLALISFYTSVIILICGSALGTILADNHATTLAMIEVSVLVAFGFVAYAMLLQIRDAGRSLVLFEERAETWAQRGKAAKDSDS